VVVEESGCKHTGRKAPNNVTYLAEPPPGHVRDAGGTRNLMFSQASSIVGASLVGIILSLFVFPLLFWFLGWWFFFFCRTRRGRGTAWLEVGVNFCESGVVAQDGWKLFCFA